MNMVIAIDFDGTCVAHEYPRIGKDIEAVPVLKKIIKSGNNIILHTMRSGKELEEAVEWFKTHEIPLYGVNENPSQKSWTKSPKIYAHMYIDDAALGIPLKLDEDGSVLRPYVDWVRIEVLLKEKGIIKDE